MNLLQNCSNYLDAHSIRYVHTAHSPAYTAEEVAAAEHMPAHRMAKTVICRDNEDYLMVVVPGDTYVDLEQLRTAIGAPRLHVARESDLHMLFPGAELGAMPPLGILFDMRVYLDQETANQEFIAFNAGTHRDVIHMRVADFEHLVRPVVGNFCQPHCRLSSSLT